MDTQLKVLKYAVKQNSDILWYPIKNVDTQFTKKKNGAYLFTQWPQILIWSYASFRIKATNLIENWPGLYIMPFLIILR